MRQSIKVAEAGLESGAANITQALSNYDVPAIRRYQKKVGRPDINHIPGDDGLPLLGHFLNWTRDLHGWENEQYRRHGPVFRFRTPVIDGVFMIGPEANRLVLQNEQRIFSNYLAWAPTFDNLFDNALLQRDFDDHKGHRKTLQAAFKRQAIEGHIELMGPQISKGISRWPANSEVLMLNRIKELLLEVGSQVFLGVPLDEQAAKLNTAFTDIVAGTADPIRSRALWFSPYARGVRGRRVISEFITRTIPERRAVPTRDIFSQMCQLRGEDGQLVSDEDIRDDLIFLLFAAHDTTTTALCAILYALADNPEWQEEVCEEMRSFGTRTLNFEDIEKMQKTGWTFSEALRMYPALHSFPRQAISSFEFGGHVIPANTNVILSPLMTHYMPEFWTEPQRFDPLRFSPERAEDKKDFFQYIPFGGGAHKCLGLHFAQVQAKIVLFHLLSKYKVCKARPTTSYRFNPVPLAFPTDGLPLVLRRH